MIDVTEVVTVASPVADVFDYLVDFGNTAVWDPGIESAVKTTPGEVQVGSEFALVARFLGTSVDMVYRIEAIEPGRQVRARGTGARAVSVDTITVEPADGGTRVTYRVQLSMIGLARIAEPFLRRSLRKMGAKALRGLQQQLGRGAAPRASLG